MRRNTRWFIAPALLALFGSAPGSVAAPTCSCAWPGPPLEALARSELVFAGTVVGREEPPPVHIEYQGDSIWVISGADMIRWRVVPSMGWKGDFPDTVAVYSMRDGAACGFGFELGESYLIYSSSWSESGWFGESWPPGTEFPANVTHLCSRTRRLDQAAFDLAELGEPLWAQDSSPPADVLRLHRAWPNPSRGPVALWYRLPRSGHARVVVYDISGRTIAVLRDRTESSGWRTIEWDGRDRGGRLVSSGTYFVRLESGEAASTRKVVVAR